jgi:hypothetical protein
MHDAGVKMPISSKVHSLSTLIVTARKGATYVHRDGLADQRDHRCALRLAVTPQQGRLDGAAGL